MPVDSRSPNRNYPVPNSANLISEDFPRLITAINAVDTDVHGLLSSVAARALLTHGHAIADVSGLQAALDDKAPAMHTHTLDSLTDVTTTGASTGQVLIKGAGDWQPGTITPAGIGALSASAASAFGLSLIDDLDAAAARATLGLGSSALMSDDRIAYGNANATISASARVVGLNAALTAPRTFTLPAANAPGAPPYILVVDEIGAISATNTLTLSRAGSDTISGLTTLVLNAARSFVILARDGVSLWTVLKISGGGNASELPSNPVGGISATNVQAALQELDTEKLALTGGTMTGFLDLRAINGDQGASGAGATEGSIRVRSASGTGDSALARMTFLCTGSYGTGMHLRADGYFGVGGWSHGSWRWYFDASGNMVAAGNVSAYSDERLKDDVKPIEGALAKITQLDGVTFTWNNRSKLIGEAGKADIGVIAQQVEKIFPEMVSASVDDPDTGEVYKTVSYPKLIPVLIEAIKELTARVERLEAGNGRHGI